MGPNGRARFRRDATAAVRAQPVPLKLPAGPAPPDAVIPGMEPVVRRRARARPDPDVATRAVS
ncbi:hypothetical protein GCM10009533_67340 [Saccharopolyspora spinosporotrichia]|uniref:Uncharacterized protein n=1 Tax=Saccharopolyspora erythraea TaxID=1836 RepID=A0ABP3PCW4_SACER